MPHKLTFYKCLKLLPHSNLPHYINQVEYVETSFIIHLLRKGGTLNQGLVMLHVFEALGRNIEFAPTYSYFTKKNIIPLFLFFVFFSTLNRLYEYKKLHYLNIVKKL